MIVYVYSLPAIVAFALKTAMLGYWWRSPTHDIRTQLFVIAISISMSMNVIEFTGLQKYWGDRVDYAGYLYNGLLAGLFAVLVHLTIRVAYDEPPRFIRTWLIPLMYGYLLCLCVLLAGSDLVIAGFELFGGYTITRIPGPFYPAFEAFGIATLLTIVALPIRGLRQTADGKLRSRCQIWMIAAMPASLIVIAVLVLLRLNIKWFNATVTLPIPMTLLLVAIGYCVHNRRIIELSSYLPFTKHKRSRDALHTSLGTLAADVPRVASLKVLLDRLSGAIGSHVYLVGVDGLVCGSAEIDADLSDLSLADVRETIVAREAHGPLKQKMAQHRLGAIVPLFSTSEAARRWLVFGETFETQIYTPTDFQMLDVVVKQLAGRLLDQFAKTATESNMVQLSETHAQASSETPLRPLPERLARYEADLIEEALRICDGNKAKAARLLGLQPNTLHYKLRRLSSPTSKK